MKPYQQIPIFECGEPLVAIPLEQFSVESPHPYLKVGATYDRSPYLLRQGVLDRLIAAQNYLQQLYPGWKIQIFDAYRPVSVQQYMVDYTFREVVQRQGLNPDRLSTDQKQAIWEQVYQIWAVPNDNPATPPPHSTGAAVDITLVDEMGQVVDMGSAIDELSDRSHPNYYANSTEKPYHAHRQLLRQIMVKSGFQPHPIEWWHFSQGDQMWAWLERQDNPYSVVNACYGRV